MCNDKFCDWLFRRHRDVKIDILLLGIDNSGKTEIGHYLNGTTRDGYTQTNGVNIYDKTEYSQQFQSTVRFTEIGGNKDIRNIWKSYYGKVMGIIYVIDISSPDVFTESLSVFEQVISHRHVQGKPILILGNKYDLCRNFDEIEFYNSSNIEALANHFQCNMRLEFVGRREYDRLDHGITWLCEHIMKDHRTLKNRIKFDRNDLYDDLPFDPRTKRERERHEARRNFRNRSHPVFVDRARSAVQRMRVLVNPTNIMRRPRTAPAASNINTSNNLSPARVEGWSDDATIPDGTAEVEDQNPIASTSKIVNIVSEAEIHQ